MKKSVLAVILVALILIGVSPVLIYANRVQISKYSIPAIALCSFHLLYGFAAWFFRYKGNYLRLNIFFIRHWFFYLFESKKDHTLTNEYRKTFYRMLVIYFAVLPLYIPCVFLTSSAAAMILPVLVFLIPQTWFVSLEVRDFSNRLKQKKEKQLQEEREKQEQERCEEMGYLK